MTPVCSSRQRLVERHGLRVEKCLVYTPSLALKRPQYHFRHWHSKLGFYLLHYADEWTGRGGRLLVWGQNHRNRHRQFPDASPVEDARASGCTGACEERVGPPPPRDEATPGTDRIRRRDGRALVSSARHADCPDAQRLPAARRDSIRPGRPGPARRGKARADASASAAGAVPHVCGAGLLGRDGPRRPRPTRTRRVRRRRVRARASMGVRGPPGRAWCSPTPRRWR